MGRADSFHQTTFRRGDVFSDEKWQPQTQILETSNQQNIFRGRRFHPQTTQIRAVDQALRAQDEESPRDTPRAEDHFLPQHPGRQEESSG